MMSKSNRVNRFLWIIKLLRCTLASSLREPVFQKWPHNLHGHLALNVTLSHYRWACQTLKKAKIGLQASYEWSHDVPLGIRQTIRLQVMQSLKLDIYLLTCKNLRDRDHSKCINGYNFILKSLDLCNYYSRTKCKLRPLAPNKGRE